MVAAGDHRRGGAVPERREGRGKRKGRSTAHPGSARTAETTAGAEEGGGAARVDEDGGAPAVGRRNGGVDKVDEDAAKTKEAMPKREEVRGDDGGEPELGGDGGERGRRRGLDSDGERKRRVAETEEGGTGSVCIVLGVREGGRRGRKSARRSRAPLMRRRGSREKIPRESEGEREGKVGGKREGITGSDFPLFIARGDGGMRRNPRRRRR